MRTVPATSPATRRWVPVRAVAVSHLRHARHRTGHCLPQVRFPRSGIRRYRSRQSQQPGKSQSKNAQFRSPLTQRGFAAEAITVTVAHSSVLAMYSTKVRSASPIWGAAAPMPITQTIPSTDAGLIRPRPWYSGRRARGLGSRSLAQAALSAYAADRRELSDGDGGDGNSVLPSTRPNIPMPNTTAAAA
jgi:hypothetical protein